MRSVPDRRCYNNNGQPKRRYATRADAKNAVRTLIKMGVHDGVSKPYYCDHCGYFHLGHYPTNLKTRAKRRNQHRKESE